MIIVFDENKFRLEKTVKRFRIEGFPSVGRTYEDYDYYTKPMVTVLINPERDKISHYMSSMDTLNILVLKKPVPEAKPYKNVVISPDGTITIDQIKKIVFSCYGYDFEIDEVNYIAINNKIPDIFFGIPRLFLEKREYYIVRFLAYNKGKRFTIDEIFEYMHLEKKIKFKTFEGYVASINKKAKDQNLEDVISRNEYGYKITNILRYVPRRKPVKK